MKIYTVKIKKYDGSIIERTVLANTIEKAIDNTNRYIKKNFYSNTKISSIEENFTIDIVYKN